MDNLSPGHYQKGKIQVWDFIIDQGLDFLEGNVVKYLCRYKEKNGIEDLRKAQVYLEKKIQQMLIENESPIGTITEHKPLSVILSEFGTVKRKNPFYNTFIKKPKKKGGK